MSIGERLNELLTEDKTLIKINPGFGPDGFFNINKSVVISWFVILFFLLLCIYLTSNLKLHNISKKQLIAETLVLKLRGLTGSLLGPSGAQYNDFMVTVMLYIGLCNLTGVLGFTPPTMDLNITVGLAVMSIVLVQIAGIRKGGAGGWLKSFAKPNPVIAPMNVLELGIRPLSLCMRLFGNVLGATVIMELIKMAVPVFVPAVLSLYFDFFDGLIQAYVFVFLTSLYIKQAVE